MSAKPYADYLQYLGRLIIITIGANINVIKYQQLTRYVYQWQDYEPPSTLANDIISSFSCNSGATNQLSTESPQTTTIPIEPHAEYCPCFTKILFLIDNTFYLTEEQFNNETQYIADKFVSDLWTHFDRIAVASMMNTKTYPFGSFNSSDSLQSALISIKHTYVSDWRAKGLKRDLAELIMC